MAEPSLDLPVGKKTVNSAFKMSISHIPHWQSTAGQQNARSLKYSGGCTGQGPRNMPGSKEFLDLTTIWVGDFSRLQNYYGPGYHVTRLTITH